MDETRVLVVDDDEPIRRLIGTVLRRAGYGIDEARHGGEAVGMIQQNDYDVVLLDLMMPVLSGFEVIDWMLDNDHERLRCVVVMSAAADRDLARLDPRMVFSVLRKPFDLAVVVETVAECAKRARSHDEGPPADLIV
jgi:CheY-like chemotaxis protein